MDLSKISVPPAPGTAYLAHQGAPGPAVLELSQDTGRIRIEVDPSATSAHVLVRTEATSGPVADAIRRTVFTQEGIRLKVEVPPVAGHRGVVFNNGSVFVGGNISGRVIINGVDMSNHGEPDIVTVVTLPPGSWVSIDTQSADTEITGTVDNLFYNGSSGRLHASHAHALSVDLSSGQATVARVTGEMDVRVSSGQFGVQSYGGSRASVRLSSGMANISAAPESSGTFDARVSSGSLRLTGSGHLDVRRKVSSGVIHVS